VTIGTEWVAPLVRKSLDRLLGRQTRPDVTATMERLISRKAKVTGELEQKRAAMRFEPEREAEADLATLSEESAAPPVRPVPNKDKTSLAAEREADSYTERLLKAKKRAQGPRKSDDSPGAGGSQPS
jgi:hypothetical protein